MSPIRKRSNDDGTGDIAYVMTHYPYPSQTFLMEEVLGVEGDGLHVAPIAINPAAESDMLTDELRPRARSHVLRQVAVVAAARLRHRPPRCAPSGPARRRVPRAMRSAGADLRLALWRAFHVAEGVVVWEDPAARRDQPHSPSSAACRLRSRCTPLKWPPVGRSGRRHLELHRPRLPRLHQRAGDPPGSDCFGVDGRVHLGLHRIAGHAAGVTGGLAQGPRRAMRHRPRPLSDACSPPGR